MESYAEKLRLSYHLRAPVIRAAIDLFDPLSGSRGLDAGCGLGQHTRTLADAAGNTGRITGVDISGDMVKEAGSVAQELGYGERVTFKQGDINNLPFAADSFDWLWSVDCAGYPATGSVELMHELARVVRPGGSIALLGWSSQQLLPGYPMLEARLNADYCKYIAYLEGKAPAEHFMCAHDWFNGAGLTNIKTHTLVGEICAPLSDSIRKALISLFEMLWDKPKLGLHDRESTTFHKLTDPDSKDLILNRSNYYAFFTYTMFTGTVGSNA